MFGDALFDRPWNVAAEPMRQARLKADAAFEFFAKLGVPFYCFHDTDVAPEGSTLREYRNNMAEMVDVLGAHQARTSMKLLWGTANLFGHPRYAAGLPRQPRFISLRHDREPDEVRRAAARG